MLFFLSCNSLGKEQSKRTEEIMPILVHFLLFAFHCCVLSSFFFWLKNFFWRHGEQWDCSSYRTMSTDESTRIRSQMSSKDHQALSIEDVFGCLIDNRFYEYAIESSYVREYWTNQWATKTIYFRWSLCGRFHHWKSLCWVSFSTCWKCKMMIKDKQKYKFFILSIQVLEGYNATVFAYGQTG